MTAAEARVRIRDSLAALGYRPNEGEEGTMADLSSRARIDVVLETNVKMARGWAQHCQRLADPNCAGQELYRLYQRKVPRDWVTRWLEAAQAVGWEGVSPNTLFIARLDSPIWVAISRFGLPYPPFDFNSGMSTRPVSADALRAAGLEPPPPTPPEELPGFNEQVEASLSGLDEDLASQLERALGAIAERFGMRLRMTDLNGSRPYSLQQLGSLFTRPLPQGVPSLQADAYTAWQKDPGSLLPGGANAKLLPALAAFAARISGKKPQGLDSFLNDAQEKARQSTSHATKSSTAGSSTDGQKPTAENPPYRRDGESGTLPHGGGIPGDGQGLRYGVSLPEVRSRLEETAGDTPAVFREQVANTSTAQLNAVFSGGKPAFLETIPGFTRSLAGNLPPGCRYAEGGGLECIYNEQAVARELNLPPGADVHAAVQQALSSGNYGRILGYGADTVLDRPATSVNIYRNGEAFTGFITSPDAATANRYATERLRDFQEQFPEDTWKAKLNPIP